MEAAVRSLNLDQIKECFTKSANEGIDNKTQVDTGFRCVLLDFLSHTISLEQVLSIVQLSIDGFKAELCNPNLPLLLLGDIFETSPVPVCEQVFGFVEETYQSWKELVSTSSSMVVRASFLRMCNDLLRRLSQTLNTEFYGRVLILMAKCLPLTEKSGLNLVGQFNTDNTTGVDPEENQELLNVNANTEEMEVEEGEMKDNSSDIPVDYALYCKFWQLQAFFCEPASCFNKFKWKKFQSYATEVTNIFASYKLEDSVTRKRPTDVKTESDNDPPARKKARVESIEAMLDVDVAASKLIHLMERRKSKDGIQKDAFFAKYLTSQKLLQLQLNDSLFRRYLLVQFIITFQYLLADVKFKDNRRDTLTEDQTKWVEESTEKCYKLLSETYPDGPKFSESIKSILEREQHWSDWKNSGCSDFTLRGDDRKNIRFNRKPRHKFDPTKVDLANPELTRLWNIAPNTLEACTDDSRKFVPSLEELIETPWEQSDPGAGIEDQYKLVNDENFQWRSMRVLMIKSPQFLNLRPVSVANMGKVVETVITKTAEQIPKFKKLGEQRKKDAEERKKKLEEEEIERKEREEKKTMGQLGGDSLVSESHIEELAELLGSDWIKLAKELEYTDDTIKSYKKKSKPSEIVTNLLKNWIETEGSDATTRKLCTKLLEAELYNEHVAAALSKQENSEEEGQIEEEEKGKGEKEVEKK